MKIIDCTLRDGGYYNNWDFPDELINKYLLAMESAGIDYVELGFRFFETEGKFLGGCAYSTDDFIATLKVPDSIKLGVMLNASDLLKYPGGPLKAIESKFRIASECKVSLVRIACHIREIAEVLVASEWLKNAGYKVGINLMQIAGATNLEVIDAISIINKYPPNVLYFADSLGSLDPEATARIVKLLSSKWVGDIGIHTHDNKGFAISNTKRALDEGVSWVDCTVTGMGRGPGNAQTEYLLVELENFRKIKVDMKPLVALITKYFQPMKNKYCWGMNIYYYMCGEYGIHPMYVQEMISDPRFDENDILAVLSHLKNNEGNKYSLGSLEAARNYFIDEPKGDWSPSTLLAGKEVLIIGAGEGVKKHRQAIESYIRREKPIVIALNCNSGIDESAIDLRVACHPLRLIADAYSYSQLPQPLVTPISMLPDSTKIKLSDNVLLDYGIKVKANKFEFLSDYAVVPNSLAISYALSIATNGKATGIILAGFDGYSSDDPRTIEINKTLKCYFSSPGALSIKAITPSTYDVTATSIYII
jgi:4-hydroxy 2-oxovalerate aldolase